MIKLLMQPGITKLDFQIEKRKMALSWNFLKFCPITMRPVPLGDWWRKRGKYV
jgi:hypothetical protein